MMKQELKQHYLATTYSVLMGNNQYEINIGKKIPTQINHLLGKNKSAVILTAWNPRSQAFSSAENNDRNNLLKALLTKNNYSFYDALGQGDDATWPAEESFFIVGMNKDEAEQLAVEHGQYAYVLLESEKPASLIFTSLWDE